MTRSSSSMATDAEPGGAVNTNSRWSASADRPASRATSSRRRPGV
ncbi:hypothetical protein AB0I28_37800 [Phytomonospora sp. NPDC050363]